jgi:hypothetical protein
VSPLAPFAVVLWGGLAITAILAVTAGFDVWRAWRKRGRNGV